ncbi:hypothetical protein K435DRAFT_809943 [Dendrothele bispora CBS 962.96]|uniref:PQ-loop-domain-containing protein n=1 Tax=Dendrothele bispora (strain CBS 962.96) TaxID=1314807 RepID=A0A4S8KWN8_DENBC|nr:hypothetical protein K435DRAFT_809943 [Dendrothele bispora CBS 962.96]
MGQLHWWSLQHCLLIVLSLYHVLEPGLDRFIHTEPQPHCWSIAWTMQCLSGFMNCVFYVYALVIEPGPDLKWQFPTISQASVTIITSIQGPALYWKWLEENHDCEDVAKELGEILAEEEVEVEVSASRKEKGKQKEKGESMAMEEGESRSVTRSKAKGGKSQ